MQALRIGIAVVVTAIWAATYGRYIIAGGAAPPPELSGVMLAVVTAVMGAEIGSAWRKRNGKSDGR